MRLPSRPSSSSTSGQAPDEPVNAFWGPIYERCGLTDLGRLFPVETKVDGRTVRAWLNCGMFAVRPDRGLCREWAEILGGFLRDADFQPTAVTDAVRRTFLHQAVISALVVARLRRGEIRMLSSGYNYPLFCHGLDFKTAAGAFRIPADKSVTQTLNELGLCLSIEKTRITTYGKGYTFLGFVMSSRSRRMRGKSERKFREKLEALTVRSHNLDAQVIEKLNQVIRGTALYFATRWFTGRQVFRNLDCWIRRRVRCMKYKRFRYPDNRRWRVKQAEHLGLLRLESFCG